MNAALHAPNRRDLHLLYVVGARPNFMKVSAVMRALEACTPKIRQTLVHTGQHYDHPMSGIFLEQLALPVPARNLEVGSGSHAVQTARILERFEIVVLDLRPDWVFVVGDVNSTLGCALVCAKLGVPVAHVEAGLRSHDRTMPEEVNRLVTDHLADLLFTPSRDADDNLMREGVSAERIHFVGNVLVDTLYRCLPSAKPAALSWIAGLGARGMTLVDESSFGDYVLLTIHRPENVDDPSRLREIVSAVSELSQRLPVLFPVHPRTRERLWAQMLSLDPTRVLTVDPLGYLEFLGLEQHAKLVLTDSGGIQEETTILGVPCLTLRDRTERPVTVREGTNQLVAAKAAEILIAAHGRLDAPPCAPRAPEGWDGNAGARLAQVFTTLCLGARGTTETAENDVRMCHNPNQ